MSNKKHLSFEGDQEAAGTLLAWWKELDRKRGERAELRRCKSPTQVAFCLAYHTLLNRYHQSGYSISPFHKERLAIVAGLLAHVDGHTPEAGVAEQMASSSKGSEKKSPVSGLRFRQLLKVQDSEDLFISMIRTIRLLGRNANIFSLAQSVLWWNDNTRKQWAYDYYAKAPNED